MNNKETKNEEKSYYEKLNEELSYKSKNFWEVKEDVEIKKAFELSEDYKRFLSECKTEREVVNYFLNILKKKSYINIEDENIQLKKGDGFYLNIINKALIIGRVGEEDFENGLNIIAAHNDVPRLDLKQNPLYEDSELALLRTHYYGGIKKYQWLNIPLALHGIVFLENGKSVEITIGEKENDPVFVISDLLPHLAQKVQGEKKLLNGIEGENLILIAGNIPIKDKKIKEKVKLNILEKLNKDYGIKEEDFISAEIEVVPALKAYDVGFDRSLIGGYGHDDRVCSYLACKSLIESNKVKKISIALLLDKEEIGSSGMTGADSMILYHLYSILAKVFKKDSPYSISKALRKSYCISSDVSAAFDPLYKSVFDQQNTPYLSHGVSLLKYTGSGGKSASNDADPEFFAKLRNLLNKNNILWQYATLGKVDEGGGGTVAKYISFFGISTIDAGVPVLGMHAPFEIISKADLYETFSFYKMFYEEFN
ncbi:MAG: aminopeptidase [Spirochaetes bacterium]|nr:aminopeptidase [Spirochaetota bacterium]